MSASSCHLWFAASLYVCPTRNVFNRFRNVNFRVEQKTRNVSDRNEPTRRKIHALNIRFCQHFAVFHFATRSPVATPTCARRRPHPCFLNVSFNAFNERAHVTRKILPHLLPRITPPRPSHIVTPQNNHRCSKLRRTASCRRRREETRPLRLLRAQKHLTRDFSQSQGSPRSRCSFSR